MAEQKGTSSKLISKLKEISRGTASPLGFGRLQARNVPAMLVVASLGRNDPALAEAAIAAGADALELHLHGRLSEFIKKQEDKDTREDQDEKERNGKAEKAALPEASRLETTQGEETAEVPSSAPSGEDGVGPSEESGSSDSAKDEETEGDQVRFGGLAEEKANIQAVLGVAGDKPVGVVVGQDGELTLGELDELAQMGVDFVVAHPHRAPADLLGVEALGHVARLDRDYPAGPLRGLNELDLDAMEVVVGRPASSLSLLTIHDLASIRQAIEPLRRPVLLLAAKTIQPGDLKHVREIGIEGLVLGPDLLGQTADEARARVADYRQAVDVLGPPIGRGRATEGRRVILPRVRTSAEAEEEDDDED